MIHISHFPTCKLWSTFPISQLVSCDPYFPFYHGLKFHLKNFKCHFMLSLSLMYFWVMRCMSHLPWKNIVSKYFMKDICSISIFLSLPLRSHFSLGPMDIVHPHHLLIMPLNILLREVVFIWPSDIYFWTVFGSIWLTRKKWLRTLHIGSLLHISAVKFNIGFEENVSFLFIPKSHKVLKEQNGTWLLYFIVLFCPSPLCR